MNEYTKNIKVNGEYITDYECSRGMLDSITCSNDEMPVLFKPNDALIVKSQIETNSGLNNNNDVEVIIVDAIKEESE